MFVDRPLKKMHAHTRSFYYYIGIFIKKLSYFINRLLLIISADRKQELCHGRNLGIGGLLLVARFSLLVARFSLLVARFSLLVTGCMSHELNMKKIS